MFCFSIISQYNFVICTNMISKTKFLGLIKLIFLAVSQASYQNVISNPQIKDMTFKKVKCSDVSYAGGKRGKYYQLR